MDYFCGSPFWQQNLSWNTTKHPDLSPCFQETVLVWIPCLILWMLTPLEMALVYRSERRYIPVSLLNIFKIFLTTVLCLFNVIELIEALTSTEPVALVSYVTPIIKSLTYILVFALYVFHRNRGVHTSGLMLLFWILMLIVNVINFRSIVHSSLSQGSNSNPIADWQLSELKFTLRLVSGPIVLVQLVLACIADEKAHDPFMTTSEDYRNRSPENDASICSLITFWWLNHLFWIGYKRPLTQEDIYCIRPDDKAEIISQQFDKLLQPAIQQALDHKRQETSNATFDTTGTKLIRNTSERNSWIPLVRKRDASRKRQEKADEEANIENQEPKFVSVTSIIVKTFWPSLLPPCLLKLITTLLSFTSPIMLDRIITFISSDEPNWRGILYASTLFILSITETLLSNREQYLTSANVMKIKTCLTTAIYRKTLRLSNQGRKNYTTGQISNLMSTDTQRVADLVQNANSLWAAPLQLILSMVLLYQQLGMSIFAGIGIMLLNVPFNGWVAIRLKELQRLVMRYKDQRIKLLSEIFSGIKVIKIHAWEDAFRSRVESIRRMEFLNMTTQSKFAIAVTFSFASLPIVVAIATFTTYVLWDRNHVLDANKIFVSISLFNMIRIPLAILPMIITNFSLFIVSKRRIGQFLESGEVDPESIRQIEDDEKVVSIEGGSFKWDKGGETVLEHVDFSVSKRKLVAIIGPVGSGKSSILSAIIGELEKCEGQVKIDRKSSMAYVPQEAWILNATVKKNILFNKMVNEDKYQRIIDDCALGPDLKTLQKGDQSEIGEKGINLSGGQKQRISLARAVYADADIYLFDDPLNAVDAHVGRHIFDNIIGPKGCLRDRTRIIATNKLSILPEVDHIYVLKDGKITESGSYEQLLKNRGLFSQLLVKYLIENSDDTDISEGGRAELITKELRRLEEKFARESIEIAKMKKEEKPEVKNQGKDNDQPTKIPDASSSHDNLTGQEVSQVGSVGLNVHINFVRTMGMKFVLALAIYIMSSGFTISSNIWLSDWSGDAKNETLRNSSQQRSIRLGVYAGLGLGETFCVMASTLLLNLACLKGSQRLHNKMLYRILRAPLSWFNVTPSGRIINRFSKDVDTVDSTIRFNVRMLMVITLRSLTSLVLISLGSVYSIIFIVPIVLLYFLFQIFYISTSRQLRRIESATKSPIYSHFGEAISGASCIRAFGVSQEFIFESNHRIDVNNACYYLSFVTSRWLAIRLEFLGFLVVLTSSLIAVLSRGSISPGVAGLTVTYSLSITSVLSFLVRTYSDYETNVVSVERLLEYTRTPVEPDDDEEPSDPNWPAKGEILFDDLSARYRPDLGLILRRFNLKIKPAEKVGLVGRTGAGKSSVTLALFRVLEAENGRIVIDDVDISHINLKVLRSKLSIIPQEPILFTGTVRQNIDPTETYSDEQIWKAIDLAHLGQFLRNQPYGLDQEVFEGGSNFSVGQKQLFCLARTLLRRSKILVLDEATAAVDVETDDLIQKTIRKEFKNSTILTIAHRLETIQDYDNVILMENGVSVEQGMPSVLLKRPNSKFYSLAQEAGLAK